MNSPFKWASVAFILMISSCNYYTTPLCPQGSIVNLDQYVGVYKTHSLGDNESYELSGVAKFTYGEKPGTYSIMVKGTDDEAFDTILKNGVTCKSNGYILLEQASSELMETDEDRNNPLAKTYSVASISAHKKEFSIKFFQPNLDALEKDGIDVIRLDSEIGYELSIIDNSPLTKEEFFNYFNKPSPMLIKK